MTNYYRILGLSPGSSKADVKKAYRRLALKYHPDHNKQPGAQEKFLAITEAYNYLMDPPPARNYTNKKQTSREADDARRKRAQDKAKAAARQRYAAFKKQQEAELSRSYSQAVTTFVGIVLLIGSIYFGRKYIIRWQVNSNPAEVVGKVVNHKQRHILVRYDVNGTRYLKKFSCTRSKLWLVTPNGMPALDGLEFIVRHKKDDPSWAILIDDKFTPKTLNMYLEMLEIEVGKNMQLDTEDARINCLSLMTYERFGVEGLANLFFWQESPLENLKNNSITYGNMADKDAFKQILKECLFEQNRFPEDVDER